MKSKIEQELGKATLLMRWVGVGLLVIGGIAGGVPAFATSPAYRCIRDGQTVLTDRPCDGSASPSSSSGVGEKIVVAAPTVVGEWRGQTQYQGAENGQLIGEAHTVVPENLADDLRVLDAGDDLHRLSRTARKG